MKKQRLGDILLARGVVDTLQLQSALAFQRKWGMPLGQVVVDQGFCAADDVFSALTEQTGLAAVELDEQTLDPRLARLVPLKVAESHRVVPLRLEGSRDAVLVVAIAAPATLISLDVVKSVSGKRVVARLAPDTAIRRAIGRLYRGEVHALQRPEDQVAVSLPEADEDMPFMANCLAEDVIVGLGPHGRSVKQQSPAMELDGLPLLSPLELDTVLSELVSVVDAVMAGPQPAITVEPPRVQVYGWGAEASEGLVRVLGEAGIAARVATSSEVYDAGEDMVVISPLPSAEALGQRLKAQLLVAGKEPEMELMRAQALGARGFVTAPVDPDLLMRAVRRLLRSAERLLPWNLS
jgi:type IV pilus assembly protein PilB